MRSPRALILGLAALSLAVIGGVSFLSPPTEGGQAPLTVTMYESETAKDTALVPRQTPFPLPRSLPRLGGDTRTVSQTAPRNDLLRLLRLKQQTYELQPAPTGPSLAQQGPQGPEVSQTQHLILKPFGLHRSGFEGASLYLASLVTLLSTSILTLWLFPARLGRLRRALNGSRRHCLRLGAIGLLGYMVALMLGLLLALMVTGLPIAITLLAGLAALTFLGLVAVAFTVGRWALKGAGTGPASPFWELVAGMLILFPLSLLPFIGWPLMGLAAIFGFGAILATKFGSEEGWALPTFLDE